MVELFIKHGADVNLLDDGKCLRWTPYICRGGTALHWAVRLGKKSISSLIISKDTDWRLMIFGIYRTHGVC